MGMVWRALLWIGFAGALALLLLGFLGTLHPLFDSLAIGRPVAAVLTGLLAILLARPLWLTWPAGGSAAVVVAALLAGKLPGPAGEITVYSKNMYRQNGAVPALADDIRSTQADVVLLQEVSTANERLLTLLATDYPHQHLCRFTPRDGVAVLSRTPFVGALRCTERRGAALAPVETERGPVWVASVHLSWPYPYDQASRAAEVAALLADLDGPVIWGGDMNTVPWAATVRTIGRVAGTKPARARHTTFLLLGWIPLPLDQVHAPDGGRTERRPQFGSDHFGIYARVNLADARTGE